MVKISKVLKDRVEKKKLNWIWKLSGIQKEPVSRALVWGGHWDKVQNIWAKIWAHGAGVWEVDRGHPTGDKPEGDSL